MVSNKANYVRGQIAITTKNYAMRRAQLISRFHEIEDEQPIDEILESVIYKQALRFVIFREPE